jgi:hypothetical protein
MEIELGISNNAHDNIEQPVGAKRKKRKKKAINKVRPFSMHHLKPFELWHTDKEEIAKIPFLDNDNGPRLKHHQTLECEIQGL